MSNNGKRARGVCTKHRFTHLKRKCAISNLPLPSLALLALTRVQQTISGSAARSLASLGSAQLVPKMCCFLRLLGALLA